MKKNDPYYISFIKMKMMTDILQELIKEPLDNLSFSEKEFPDIYKYFEQPVMSRPYFDQLINNFRSPHLWYHHNDEWFLRKTFF